MLMRFFPTSAIGTCVWLAIFAAVALSVPASAQTFDFGTAPTAAEIAAINIDAMPDGRGLPAGKGTPSEGKAIYVDNCAACHGTDLQGVKDAGGAPLVGGRGSLMSGSPKKTIESYWPYATTVFDYVKRAMPFNAPGSLNDNQVYAVTAYILYRGDLIGEGDIINAKTLPRVDMPNKNGFIADPRPDVNTYR